MLKKEDKKVEYLTEVPLSAFLLLCAGEFLDTVFFELEEELKKGNYSLHHSFKKTFNSLKKQISDLQGHLNYYCRDNPQNLADFEATIADILLAFTTLIATKKYNKDAILNSFQVLKDYPVEQGAFKEFIHKDIEKYLKGISNVDIKD